MTTEFMNAAEVLAELRVSDPTLKKMITAGRFPAPIKLSGNRNGKRVWSRKAVKAAKRQLLTAFSSCALAFDGDSHRGVSARKARSNG